MSAADNKPKSGGTLRAPPSGRPNLARRSRKLILAARSLSNLTCRERASLRFVRASERAGEMDKGLTTGEAAARDESGGDEGGERPSAERVPVVGSGDDASHLRNWKRQRLGQK